VAILLTYGTARVLLAGDAEAREEHRQAVRTRGLEWWLTFPNYTHSEPRFRALLTEEAPEVEVGLM
jgi:antibiotic biosynthesis monooxygenase (ABM) superfamily enzyme